MHCNYVDDQDPSAHDDSMLAANQRIWGFETNFGGLADLAVVKANQLMPKATHLTWEEAAVNALCNSTAYRMLVSHNGADHEAGRPGPRVGRQRGARELRRAARHERRRHPRGGGVLARQGRAPARPRGGGGHRPGRGGVPVLEGRAHPGRVRVAALRQGRAGAGGGRPRHRLRAPRAPDHGRLGVRVQAGRDRRDLRGHVGLHDRVRQPPPVDEAQDHQGLALRQLPRGLGRQPADLRRQGRAPALGALSPRRGR